MAEATGRVNQADAIKRHIETEREVLGADIQRLERRVRSAADWHMWLDRKPLWFLGAAFGGGMYIALKAGR